MPSHNHIDLREIDGCKRLTAETARQLLAPSVVLARADTVFVNNFVRPDARSQALRDHLALLLDRPAAPLFAARDYLDTLCASAGQDQSGRRNAMCPLHAAYGTP
jgi:hypothetical protein